MIESIENMGPFSWLLLFTIYCGLMTIGANVCVLAFNAIDGWAKFKRLKPLIMPSRAFSVHRDALEIGKYYFYAYWTADSRFIGGLVLVDQKNGKLIVHNQSEIGETTFTYPVKFASGEYYGPISTPWDKS